MDYHYISSPASSLAGPAKLEPQVSNSQFLDGSDFHSQLVVPPPQCTACYRPTGRPNCALVERGLQVASRAADISTRQYLQSCLVSISELPLMYHNCSGCIRTGRFIIPQPLLMIHLFFPTKNFPTTNFIPSFSQGREQNQGISSQ